MADPTPRLVAVETLGHPLTYAPDQIRRAYDIANAIHRGTLVLCEPARGNPDAHR